MSTSLSSVVEKLFEIYKKEFKVCKERAKIESAWYFIVLKNKKLNYECKECKKKIVKTNKLIN